MGWTMNRKQTRDAGSNQALSRLALRFYDEAHEASGGDEHRAAMVASAALMAAIDRMRDARRRREPIGKLAG